MQISCRGTGCPHWKKLEASPQRQMFKRLWIHPCQLPQPQTVNRGDTAVQGDICSVNHSDLITWHQNLANFTPQHHQPRASICFLGSRSTVALAWEHNIYACALKQSWCPPPVPRRAVHDLHPCHLNQRTLSVMKQRVRIFELIHL